MNDADMVGSGLTVSVFVAMQVPMAYVIVTVPALTPVTTPVLLPMVAIVATGKLLLAHVPPAAESDSDITDPTQTDDAVDEIGAGAGLTVTVAVTKQPLPV
jgi:hypothetical protein